MKDYFDLWVLLRDDTLDAVELNRAITATFSRRNMSLPTFLPVGLSDAFVTDVTKQIQWNAFLKKNQLAAMALADVVTVLRNRVYKAGVI